MLIICFSEGAINNSNNSQEAQDSAQERLNQLEQSGELDGQGAHDGQVKRGHKVIHHSPRILYLNSFIARVQAALNNPNSSQEAKEHSQRIIEDLDAWTRGL